MISEAIDCSLAASSHCVNYSLNSDELNVIPLLSIGIKNLKVHLKFEAGSIIFISSWSQTCSKGKNLETPVANIGTRHFWFTIVPEQLVQHVTWHCPALMG